MDKTTDVESELPARNIRNQKDLLEANEREAIEQREAAFVEEELKTVDIDKTVVYVDRPVYSPDEEYNPAAVPKGAEAVKQSTETAIQKPAKYTNGMMFYDFDETFTYEIHCQPYRTTDIRLEPGELVIEMPFLSEEQVWEVGAGVSRKEGEDVQHFFLKPTHSGLTTSMIIITNRRIYHLLLKSYSDRYMTMISWNYPNTMPFSIKTDNASVNSTGTGRGPLSSSPSNPRAPNGVMESGLMVNPEYLSFDYKMTYNIFLKPRWLPKRIYDDGRKTYIECNEIMLNMESPVLFNHKNERINYRVSKNVMIIDELIEKVTLRVGLEKVTVVKKNTRVVPIAFKDLFFSIALSFCCGLLFFLFLHKKNHKLALVPFVSMVLGVVMGAFVLKPLHNFIN
jgi:type IV secretion system protein VirB9